jgi:hypothetical protein
MLRRLVLDQRAIADKLPDQHVENRRHEDTEKGHADYAGKVRLSYWAAAASLTHAHQL